LAASGCLLGGSAAVKAAETAGSTPVGPTALQPSGWEADVRTSLLLNIRGFRPAKVVSSTSAYDVDGQDLDAAQGRFSISGAVRGRYLHWDFRPYTDVPPTEGHGYHVNTVGLETAIYVPLGDMWRVGFYHHSAHNVADDVYGFGMDLNALVVDALILNGPVRLASFSGRHGLRLHTHGYLTDRGSPWVLTRDTHLESGQVGLTRARTGFDYVIADDGLRGECGGHGTVSSSGMIASVNLGCASLWRVGGVLLGAFGEHLQVGPHVGLNVNLTRADDLGRHNFFLGLRMDFLVDENLSQGTILW
jgi:hypothetical protein